MSNLSGQEFDVGTWIISNFAEYFSFYLFITISKKIQKIFKIIKMFEMQTNIFPPQ